MNISSQTLVELLLFGHKSDRRQLQDSPILGDVWNAFAKRPAKAMDLLITPHSKHSAGKVAVRLADEVAEMKMHGAPEEEAQIAYLQGFIVARLFFEEVIRIIVPMTLWWSEQKTRALTHKSDFKINDLAGRIDAIFRLARSDRKENEQKLIDALSGLSGPMRFLTLTGIMLWAGQYGMKAQKPENDIIGMIRDGKGSKAAADKIAHQLLDMFLSDKANDQSEDSSIWQVSLNRNAAPALERSVLAVKADAARTLFEVKCSDIYWAVIDSGIDGTQPAFYDESGKSRIVKAFDFSRIRKIVNVDNRNPDSPGFEKRLNDLLRDRGKPLDGKKPLDRKEAKNILVELGNDANNDRSIHWELAEKFLEINPKTSPAGGGHGTHVAGIIGARKYKPKDKDSDKDSEKELGLDGMCPEIGLYDFRVLSDSSDDDNEFAIIAALQYIRYLNDRHSHRITIHGANLSLSIPHDVQNYACGRTPICDECQRLVDNGVVVVAAAGNHGYHRYETVGASYEGYTAFSITDPGNTDGVITVGSTHRYRPHTYGVSYFSSRGPTGDGRLKPDLVAPGERIHSCLPGGEWGDLDGTSMAAPHVSGAAAMLLARYSELIGQPHKIKKILCESATDLGRERSFQGHGMLDILRAFQSI